MSLNISPTKLVEQLFLDIPIQQVLHDTNFIEPWKTMYIDAIHDGRFGDAVWARHHIYGDAEVVPGDPANNMTVLEDNNLCCRIGHADVLEVITNLSEEIAEFKAKNEDGA
ncbi:hypothetical protein BDV12DRAFT_183571 [Aspergillus spectabilis]